MIYLMAPGWTSVPCSVSICITFFFIKNKTEYQGKKFANSPFLFSEEKRKALAEKKREEGLPRNPSKRENVSGKKKNGRLLLRQSA